MLALHQAVVGSPRVSRLLHDEIAAEARRREDWQALSLALHNTGIMLAPVDLPRAIEVTRESISCKADHGIPPNPLAWLNLANFLWLAGRWDELPEVVEQLRDSSDVLGATLLAARVAERLCAWAGRELVPTALPEPGTADGIFETIDHYRRSADALAAGDLPSAVRESCESVRMEFGFSEMTDDFHVYWPLAMRIALVADDRAAGAELMAYTANHAYGPVGSIAAHARVFRASWALRDGDADDPAIEAELRAGTDELDRCGVVVWRAHAQEDLGRLLLAQGRADEAAPFIEAARETYAALGASSWLARVEQPLRIP
jgi:hypothetical protein